MKENGKNIIFVIAPCQMIQNFFFVPAQVSTWKILSFERKIVQSLHRTHTKIKILCGTL